ncbi:MAG: sigma-70 family RNA polymerase sigma factor [Pyrinomonadaceae bacterium]
MSKSDVKTKSEQAEPSVLGRIANGDREAMSDCIRLYGGLVWSLARRMLRDAADAEDIVQEIFLELWKNAERFDPATASETTFVAMIARRRIIDRMRSVSRRPYSESLDDLLIEPSKDGAREIETRLEANRAAVALESLRKEQKDILKLSILGGMSHSEIADALGIPLGTVKTHARRGLLEMRRFLDDGKNFKEVTA